MWGSLVSRIAGDERETEPAFPSHHRVACPCCAKELRRDELDNHFIHHFVRAVRHFYELRLIKFKAPPRANSKSGTGSENDPDGKVAFDDARLAGVVFDLRCDRSHEQRLAALSTLNVCRPGAFVFLFH